MHVHTHILSFGSPAHYPQHPRNQPPWGYPHIHSLCPSPLGEMCNCFFLQEGDSLLVCTGFSTSPYLIVLVPCTRQLIFSHLPWEVCLSLTVQRASGRNCSSYPLSPTPTPFWFICFCGKLAQTPRVTVNSSHSLNRQSQNPASMHCVCRYAQLMSCRTEEAAGLGLLFPSLGNTAESQREANSWNQESWVYLCSLSDQEKPWVGCSLWTGHHKWTLVSILKQELYFNFTSWNDAVM